MTRRNQINIALLLWAFLFGCPRLQRLEGKSAVGPVASGESIEKRAKRIIGELDKIQALRGNDGAIYMFDFNNTICFLKDPMKLGTIIATDVIIKSLLDRADGIRDKYAQEIEDFLVAKAVELGGYEIDGIATVKRLLKEDEYFRVNFAELVYGYFRRKAKPNHRISYLLKFDCSREQIEANYNSISKDYMRYYADLKQNPIVVEIMCQLLAADRNVMIFTDNSETNVLAGLDHVELEKTIEKRLAKLGKSLDPRIPIFAKGNTMRRLQTANPSTRPLIPIVSVFRHKPKIAEHFYEIIAKEHPNSKKFLGIELREKYGINTGNTMMVMFDDSDGVLDNLERQGIVPVMVKGSDATIRKTQAANMPEPNPTR